MQLVAPAGSFGGLRASVKGGADAVYLGMPQFGARAKAENFNEQTFKQAVEYAHMFGVKVFVTLNTLIKDSEMSSALKTAEFVYNAGADAAIVQDIRFIEQLKKRLPDFVLHASTQLGIHNADGAKTLARLGIKRAVLSRETLPEDIAEIKATGAEIEYFVQGALCVSFSGNCYFSSLASSYSGNRGKCMQLCRKQYEFDGKRGYYLSAKDLCLYDKLRMLESLGVDAIKIEGRMRSDEYAYRTVSIYKSNMPADRAVEGLKSAFNRGDYCTGYLDGDAPFRVIYPRSQSNIGKYIGKVSAVNGKRLVVNGYSPNAADGYKIMRDGREICGASVQGGRLIADGSCKAGDQVRLTFDGEFSQRAATAERKLGVEVRVTLAANVPPSAVLTCGKTSVAVGGDSATQTAVSRALTVEDAVRAFSKTSDKPFSPNICVNMANNLFMPISALNEFRRKAYEALERAVIDGYTVKRATMPYIGLDYNRFDGQGKMLMVESADMLNKKIVDAVDYIVINPRDYAAFDVPKLDKPILLNAPITMRGKDREVIAAAIARDGIYGVVSNNLYTLSLTDKPILLGYGHNIIGKTDLPHIRSFEADDIDGGFTYVYGYAPVMTLCHCPYGKCKNCSGTDTLTDENGRRFTMRRYKAAHCYWQLLNCVPHYLCDVAKVRERINLFYDCTGVDRSTIDAILNGERPTNGFTRGNINKGLK